MKGNSAASIDFLKKWNKNGPWVVTAIQTDKKAIATATFRPEHRCVLAGFKEDPYRYRSATRREHRRGAGSRSWASH